MNRSGKSLEIVNRQDSQRVSLRTVQKCHRDETDSIKEYVTKLVANKVGNPKAKQQDCFKGVNLLNQPHQVLTRNCQVEICIFCSFHMYLCLKIQQSPWPPNLYKLVFWSDRNIVMIYKPFYKTLLCAGHWSGHLTPVV